MTKEERYDPIPTLRQLVLTLTAKHLCCSPRAVAKIVETSISEIEWLRKEVICLEQNLVIPRESFGINEQLKKDLDETNRYLNDIQRPKLQRVLRERDAAQRMYCELRVHQQHSPQSLAEDLGWLCYKEWDND